MASFSLNYGYQNLIVTVTGVTTGSTIRCFIRLASDTSNVTEDDEQTASSSTVTFSTSMLEPGTSYAVNVHDGTSWIGAKTFTTLDLPKATATSATDSSVTLSIPNLKSGYSYRVLIAPKASPTSYVIDTTFTATSSSTTRTYSGLSPETEYCVNIRVVDEGFGSGYTYFTTDAISWTLTSSALGTLSSPYSVSYSFGQYVLRRFSVTFGVSGTAKFYSSGGPDTKGWLSTTTAYDSAAGEPTSYVAYNDDEDGDVNFGFTYNVTAGTTYYLWVRLYNGTGTGSASVCIDPPVWNLTTTSLGTLSSNSSATYLFGTYVLRRFTVQFSTSGTAKFYTTGSADTKGWLSTNTTYNAYTGEPTNYAAYNDDDSGTNFGFAYDVAAGRTYYLWVRLYSGENTGTATVCIEPPAVPRPSNWAWYSTVASGAPIGLTAAEWNDFCTRINEFRDYVGLTAYSFTTAVSGTTAISATIVNQARTAISAISGHGTLPSAAVSGGTITAAFFNSLKDALNAVP